jgi:hypothetical protein
MLVEVREDIRAARSLAEARGDVDVVQKLDQALAALAPERLLTTTQAAEFLGIRSINTLKVLVRLEGLRTERHGNRMMIPMSELERIQHGSRVKSIQASDRVFADVETLNVPDGLTEEELNALEAGRPGRLPWEVDGVDSTEPGST